MNLPRPFGPYELVRQLAVGGMAEVFVARARSVAGFEKVVALKMIHSRFSEDPEFARLLVEEANITAQLSHRNIVQVIDLGQIDGTHYIAMEYVDGLDLARLMTRMKERGQNCSPRLAAFIIREVCDGLEHAHRKTGTDGKPLKIIHRDVSPPNILLSSSGEVKLTDFGIAKAALRASSTEAGVVKGKYAYMSPEQARATSVDQRTDIFAAGCVLYELATGQPVYKEAPLPILLERVTRGIYDAPERARPDLPPALIAVIKKALAANPADRYPTARAMAEDLNAFLYTVPPNPEFELQQLLNMLQESNRPSMPPMATASLLDDELDESTQIESVSVMRDRMAQPTQRPPSAGAGGAVKLAGATDSGGFADEPTRALKRGTVGAGVPVPARQPRNDDEATRAFAPPGGGRSDPPRPRVSSAPPTVRPGLLAVAPSTVPPTGLSSGGTAKVRAPGAAGRTGGTIPPLGAGSSAAPRTAVPANPVPGVALPPRVPPLQGGASGAAGPGAQPPPPRGRVKTAPPEPPPAASAAPPPPPRARIGTSPPAQPPGVGLPGGGGPPGGAPIVSRGTQPGGAAAPPARVPSSPVLPAYPQASQPGARAPSSPVLPAYPQPSGGPQSAPPQVPGPGPYAPPAAVPSVPPVTAESLPPASGVPVAAASPVGMSPPMHPTGSVPPGTNAAQLPMQGAGYGAPMYPPMAAALNSAPPGYPGMQSPPGVPMNPPGMSSYNAPPASWDHDAALAAAEQRQRRAVLFAGVFAALAVVTLIVVLITAR